MYGSATSSNNLSSRTKAKESLPSYHGNSKEAFNESPAAAARFAGTARCPPGDAMLQNLSPGAAGFSEGLEFMVEDIGRFSRLGFWIP